MTVIGAARIRRMLPHRYPILLVDRVLAAETGRRIIASKAITLNEPCYAQVGDDASLDYPPSLLLESWVQSACLLALLEPVAAGQIPLLGSMSEVDFHRPVLPGDLITHRVELSRRLDDALVVDGDCRVAGELVFTVSRMVLVFRPAERLRGAN
jgi:3-hydroxyacyl-[acyl-carrier-protein] dehydratase